MARKSRRRTNSQSQRTESAAPQAARQAKRTANEVQKAVVNPFEPMGRVMQAFMPPFGWMNPWMGAAGAESAPKLDVIEREDKVVVRAEVPGVQKTHLEVEASDVSLTIKGEMQEERHEEDERYRLHETSRGVFERTVRLPSDCDSTRAKATFKDGVLEVELPKVDRFKPHHVKF
jgi:HSP20 family protein